VRGQLTGQTPWNMGWRRLENRWKMGRGEWKTGGPTENLQKMPKNLFFQERTINICPLRIAIYIEDVGSFEILLPS